MHGRQPFRRLRTLVATGLCLSLTACLTSRPLTPEDPIEALDLGEALLVQDQPRDARTVLMRLDDDDVTGREAARYDWLWATALFQTGSAWSAYQVIAEFSQDHRFSEFEPQVQRLHYEIGSWLIQSDGGFWIFQSDASDGERVLTTFITTYPTHPAIPDALALLAQRMWEDQNWPMARRRYETILTDHPGSEWSMLANFRVAMSKYNELVGPAYDLDAMRKARNELQAFLDLAPERPEFVTTATRSLRVVRAWIAERHLLDADFYRRIGNATGERHHLEVLLKESGDSPEAEVARARLAEGIPEGEG